MALIVKNTNVSVKHHYSLLYTLARHHLCYSEKSVAWINFPSDPESKKSRPTHREDTQLMQSSLRGPVHFRHVASHAWHFVLLSWYCPDRHAAREWRWLNVRCQGRESHIYTKYVFITNKPRVMAELANTYHIVKMYIKQPLYSHQTSIAVMYIWY